MAKALFVNELDFNIEAMTGTCGAGKRTDGLDHATLATDYLAGIGFVHTDFDKNRTVCGIGSLDAHRIGAIHQRQYQRLYET